MANLSSVQVGGVAVVGSLAGTAQVDSNATGTGSPTITDVGEYRYHHYTGAGNFVMNSAGFVEILIIGGGGGASEDNSSGAGGGGFLFRSLDMPAATYAVAVGGAGGAIITTGGKGGNSVVSIISNGTAYGGGGGCSDGQTQQSQNPVGSCGGAGKDILSRASQNNQEATAGQGNCAGEPLALDDSGAPGGGGAGSPGGSTTFYNSIGFAGHGGSGEFCPQFANFGVNGWFSGGGGGGGGQLSNQNGGYGGNGGGGDGGWDTQVGIAGVSNTGGGAGGGGQGAGVPKAGGSGGVFFRYKKA